MLMRVTVPVWLVVAVIAVGCGNGSKTKDDTSGGVVEPTRVADSVVATPSIDAAAAAKPPPVESDCEAGKVTVSLDDRYDCVDDEDCVTTCAFGAVNYRAMLLLDDNCDDGCASKGLEGRCVKSRCTTIDYGGKPVDSCNDRPVPEDVCVDPARAAEANQCADGERLVPTWKRFSCETDDDCATSCKFGALNKKWADRLGPGCKDGCSGDGMHAKCVANLCTAFDYQGNQHEDCTWREAPNGFCVRN